MHIVTVITQKGGSGKTTLALSLAVAAMQAGQNVVIIDVDSQATAAAWGDRRHGHPPHVIPTLAARLPQTLKTAAEAGVDLAIIDTPPRAEQAALAAARVSELVLIPCRTKLFDLETVATTLELIRSTGTRSVAAVLNAVSARGSRHADASVLLEQLGIPVCPTGLGNREAFSDATILGQVALEYEPRGKAAAETQLVYEFMRELVNSNSSTTGGVHV
jgi:chromosome partitioning protein